MSQFLHFLFDTLDKNQVVKRCACVAAWLLGLVCGAGVNPLPCLARRGDETEYLRVISLNRWISLKDLSFPRSTVNCAGF